MTNETSPWYREEYDPDLHDTLVAPPALHGIALAIAILCALGLVAIGILVTP